MTPESDLAARRRFYAEEVQITANLRTPELIEALAAVPRERFLGPGPWTIRGEADFLSPLRQTPADDPRFVYHNIAIAIDASRNLFNGAPGLLAMMIDALGITPGQRVAHIGTGTGYYTAVMAATVGSAGRVTGVEVDPGLAARSIENLKAWPWVTMAEGNGLALAGGPFDAVLVNAGVTHVQRHWLDNLAPGGRMLMPLTAVAPAGAVAIGPVMANITKGLLMLITRTSGPDVFDARPVTFVAIYAGQGLRDEALNAKLGESMKKMPFAPIKKFRLDAHEPGPSCWMHDATGCWSL